MAELRLPLLLLLLAFSAVLSADHHDGGSRGVRTAPGSTCELLYNGGPVTTTSWLSSLNVARLVGSELLETAAAGTVYLTLAMQDIIQAGVDTPSEYLRVDFDPELKSLSLVVTEELANYDQDMISSADAGTADIVLGFTCSDNQQFQYALMVTIGDVNTHPPEFLGQPYSGDLPMPFPPDTDVSSMLGEMRLRDIDFSNTAVSIELDEQGSELFTATTSYDSNREYVVQLITKALVDLEETTTFTITAVDSGSPPLSASTTLTISRYQKTSVPKGRRFAESAVHRTVIADQVVGDSELIN